MGDITGAYQVHPEIGEDEQLIFDHVMRDLVGVTYKPVAVASQVVNGINYIFICTGRVVTPDAPAKLYAVKIYAKIVPSIAPTVELKEITEIDVASLVKQG